MRPIPRTTITAGNRPPASTLTLEQFVKVYPRIAGADDTLEELKKKLEDAEAAKAKAEQDAEAAAKKLELGEGGQATIQKERDNAAAAKRDAADARKERDALKAQLADLESGSLSETEKLKKENEELRQQAEEGTKAARHANLLTALDTAGITGTKARAAAQLLTVEFDDQHKPTNLDDAIKAARESFGTEVFGEGTEPPPNLNGNGGNGGGNGPRLTADELAAAKAAGMTPEEYQQYQSPQPQLTG